MNTPRQQSLAPPTPQPPRAPAVGGVQTGFNSNDQAVNVGNVMGRLGKEGKAGPVQASKDGQRAVADFRASQAANDASQLRRGLEQSNAQQNMQEQAMRSELLQLGMSNQAKIYGDMSQRAVSQIGLAAQLQQALMRHRNALAQALMQQ